jgi:molybdenum-dependent DNA-binding transcriptional regulator ModE
VIGLVGLSDEALALRVQSGDERAFEALAGRYRRVIGATLRGRPMTGFGMTIEDAWQEALVGLWTACRKHRPGRGRFGAYAAVCIRHRIINSRVRANRPGHRALTQAVELDRPVADDGPPLIEFVRAGRQSDPAVIVELREELATLAGQDRRSLERALRPRRYDEQQIRAALKLIANGSRQADAAAAVGAAPYTVAHWARAAVRGANLCAGLSQPERAALARVVERWDERMRRIRAGAPERSSRARRKQLAPGGDLRRRYSDEQINRALALVADGSTIRQAAAAVGAPYRAVWGWVRRQQPAEDPDRFKRRRAQWSSRRRRFSDEQVDRALAVVAEGGSISKAAAAVGASNPTIIKWLREAA